MSTRQTILQMMRRPSVVSLVLFIGLFWSCMAYVFWPVLPLTKTLPASDSPNLFNEWWLVDFFERLLSGDVTFLSPTLPVGLAAYSLYWTELFWMTPPFIAALSLAYYLRTQQLSRLAAYGAGLFFGFIGYMFTLFSAGHGTTFLTWCYVVLPFALVNRCFETRRLYYFALLGATVTWAMPQADVWMLFMFLLVSYILWITYWEWRKQKSFSFLFHVYPRFAVSAVVILLIGFLQMHNQLTGAVAAREKQFNEASILPKESLQENDRKVEAQRKFERWIFSTNWSLPPEDVLEFIVPGVFGDASFKLPCPYWGRLGQPYHFQAGRMMPNYRQHTVYIGLVTVLFALFGVVGWWSDIRSRGARRCKVQASEHTSEAGVLLNDEESRLYTACSCFRDVPFWTVASVVIVIVAMGRYTPFYNLVYQCLPFMKTMRCPVKYLHVAEMTVVMLAGFGIEALLRQGATDVRRKAWHICVVFVVCLAGLWLAVSAGSGSLNQYISGLGLGNVASILVQYALANIARAILITMVVGGLLFWFARVMWDVGDKNGKNIGRNGHSANRGITGSRRYSCCVVTGGEKTKVTALVILGAVIAIGTVDQAVVARRYVMAVDVGPHHAMNPVVHAMKSRTGKRPANVMNYVTSGGEQEDWFSASLRLHGYPNMAPSAQDPVQRALFERYQNEPLKYWEMKGVRFVLLPRKNITPFVQQGTVSVLGDFQLQNNRMVRSISPQESSFVLAEVKGYEPLPALYESWRGDVKGDQQTIALQQSYTMGVPVASLPMSSVSNNAVSVPSRAIQFDAMRRQRGVFVTRGRIESVQRPSLLVFNEQYQDKLVATVNGKEVPVGQVNGQWAAIELPAGTSEITLKLRWKLPFVLVSFLTTVGVFIWFVIHLYRWRHVKE
ncbi:MAG: hypothetical protein WCH07_08110 [Deltaproteobacteria bacterium]